MISINVNPAASGAGLNLGKANEALQKSLARLSSGRRIVNSSDDAGGLAVSMKMAAALKRTEATAINLRNMVSYLDTQDGAFKVADKVLSRMSELSALARDVSKNEGDVENYNKEFGNLKAQLTSLAKEKFNGVTLFSTDSTGSVFDVPTSEDGTQNASVTKAALASDPMMDMMINGFNSIETPDPNGKIYVYPKNSTFNGQTGSFNIVGYELPGGIGATASINLTVQAPLTSTHTITFTATGSIPAFDLGIIDSNGATSGSVTLTKTVTNFKATVDGSEGTQDVGSYDYNSYNITSTGGVATLNPAAGTDTAPSYDSARMQLGLSAGVSAGIQTDLTKWDSALTLGDNTKYYSFLSQEALQQLADMRAQNGAEMSRINFAQDLLDINAVNLEAANSRIIDVDIAAESSQLARFQILQQAGTAMLAQANTSQQSLVKLLQG